MTIVPAGTLNPTSLVVPDLIVQILPPDVSQLNGVPTNVVGLVGTAIWGPVNAPTIVGSVSDYQAKFGAMQARKFDMGTALAAAVLQGANNFRCVRVTDGTDAAATIVVLTNCITFSGKYTGTLGNSVKVAIAPGSAANSFKATVSVPGLVPEVFDNVLGSGNALWVNLAAAINSGQSGLRGPSNVIVATAGVGVTAPSTATYSLAGGVDGTATITSTVLVGNDAAVPRSGMYALRATGASIGVLADADDTTQWTNQVAFGLSEGVYMIMVGPAGDTISNAVTTKASAAVDSYAAKVLFGDWVYFNDQVNNVQRLISPQGFIAGLLANLSPEQSSLNKPLYGVVGTQKSLANQTYGPADLQSLGVAGIDVITNPVPGGNYFGARFGRNCSSNPVIHQDSYTRLTNYIAATINAGMGVFVGKLQSQTVRREAAATLGNFFDAMAFNGMIGSADGSLPYSVQIDDNNNPQNRVALGTMQADVKVRYLSVIEYFIVNVQGGQSVTVTRANTQLAA